MVLTERRNKIFLIGNGFDLAHGLPTKYIDFIKWYLKSCCLEAIKKGIYKDDCLTVRVNRGYMDIAAYIEEHFETDEIWSFIAKKKQDTFTWDFTSKPKDNDYTVKIGPINEFVYNLLSNCRDNDWSGIEFEVNRIMIQEHTALVDIRSKILIDKKHNQSYQNALNKIRELNKSIYCLKSKLIEYLKLNNSPSAYRPNLVTSFKNGWGKTYKANEGDLWADGKLYSGKESDIQRHVLFLNFNYTTYFEDKIVKEFKDYLEDQFTQIKTIYIHGDLNSETDEIVFGVGDENKETYSEIESLYDDEWLVPLKSFHYFRNEKYQQLLGFLRSGEYEVYVIGHSCSTTDRTLLNMLFEDKDCKKIHVYHHSGINSYLSTAYNIARNFNNKVKLREVLQPFNPDLTTK